MLKESSADPAAGGEPPERSASVAASGAGNTVTTYGNGSSFTLGGNKFEGRK